jgi:hypothetical protein
LENLKGRGLGELGIDGKIILKWILKKWGMMLWTVLNWLRLGSSTEPL